MQLSYRGIKYEPGFSDVAPIPGEVSGKYRGVALKFNQGDARSLSKPFALLQYRGNHYIRCIHE